MDLHDRLRLVRHRWWLVPVTVMIALGVAAFVNVRADPQYASSVTFFVTTQGRGVTDAYQGGLFLQQRVRSYVDLLHSDRLAESIVADDSVGMTAREVQARVAARVQRETVLIEATVTDGDRARSLKLTEGLARHFVRLVEEIETPAGAGDPTVKIEVVGGPRVDPEPVSPSPARNFALAGVLGLLLGAGLSVLRGLVDTSVRDGATLQRVTSAPLLGQIPYDAAAKSDRLIVGTVAPSARAEAMHMLRTNLRYVDAQKAARVIAVTSALPAEGKSTIACNLAIALAEAGWRVLLVDADLRRPRVADFFDLPVGAGLTDVLTGEVEVHDVVQPSGAENLHVLPAGSIPPNPSELLGSKTMADLLVSLREAAEIVIIDTAPVMAVADGAVVAAQADGALLVTEYGRTPQAHVAAAAQTLNSVAARLLGCVLNMVEVSRADRDHYGAYCAPAAGSVASPTESATIRLRAEDIDGGSAGGRNHDLTRIPR